MNACRRSILAAALGTILALPAAAHEVADPTIKHDARDGVVRLYGAGGPDTAFKKGFVRRICGRRQAPAVCQVHGTARFP
jgi:accessory colonization factor AcfC